MFKKILAVLLVVVIGILGMAAMKPDTFAVTRSITIKAPPEKILGMVSDFRQWQAWSPWEGLDPQMQRTFSGPANGKGAIYQWSGNKEVGQGRMEVTEVVPAAKVVIKLDFITPFESSNMTEFSTVPQGDATNVTWTMTGPMPFISKVMSVFISMDSMIGKDFEKGLAKMKAAAET
jgi:uncharacterized protein YndB with AHSA1/START domain